MRKPLLAAAALTISLLVLVATVLLIRGGLLRSKEGNAFRFAMRDAIYALEEGREAEAANELEVAASHARSESDWLTILKRARRLPDPAVYRSLLRRGAEGFPDSEPLSAALAFELVTEQEYRRAWDLVSKKVDAAEYPYLYSASLLGAEASPGRIDSEEVALFAALPDSETPEPFLRAYEATGAIPFLENALLLSLEDGAFETSRSILQRFGLTDQSEASAEQQVSDQTLRLLLMASHTTEDRAAFYAALTALGGRQGTEPEALLLQADLRMSAREHEEAARLYREVRAIAPALSEVPYLNGAYLRRMEERAALELLAEGRERFPASRALQTALLKEQLHQGEEEAAEALIATLQPYLMSKLFQIAYFRKPEVDRGYTARLWEILNAEGNPAEAGRLLAYHLVGINDYPELQRLLSRFPPEEHSWARFYLGYLSFRRGLYIRADELFSDRPERGSYPVEAWMWEGNAALAALYTGSYRRAIENGAAARELLVGEEGGDRPEYQSLLLTIEAEALRLSGRTDEALRAARRALSIHPESSSGRLVLRNLERLR